MKYVGIIETVEEKMILIDGSDLMEIFVEMFVALENKTPIRIEIVKDD